RLHEEAVPLNPDRLAEAAQDVFGDAVDRARPGLPQQDRELVAAEPRDGVLGPHAAADTLTDRAQYAVADGVPEGVVDALEVVQVDQQHGEAAARHGVGCPGAVDESGVEPV